MTVAAMLDEILDPLALCLDESAARRISAFRISPTVHARVEALGDLANDGSLTADERTEYEAIINTTDFVAILKLKATGRLATAGGDIDS